MRRVRLALLLAAMSVVVAGCTSGGGEATTTLPPSEPTTTSTSLPATSAAPTAGKLVTIDGQGQVVVMNRDGTEALVLSEVGDVPFQPVWSVDGSSIAYADRQPSPSFVVADADGGGSQRVDTPSPPFYFLWSPSGDQIASLRNGPTGILFEITTIGGGGLTVDERDQGQPYYFSWSPDGAQLVAHVGANRLDVLDSDGGQEPLIDDPGGFRAPHWSADAVFAARLSAGGQQLVRIPAGGDAETLADLVGGMVFTASPDGRRIAVQSFLEGDGSVSASFRQLSLAPNRLHVIDLETGEAEMVTDAPAVAFFWSPDGSKLLVLTPGEVRGELVWEVWDGDELAPGPTFRPGVSWVSEFLPFFDQYALGMSLWAPDSTAYAFPGTVDGAAGIWLAEPEGGDPVRVADGTWVAWSHR